jgi:hypothetical protein
MPDGQMEAWGFYPDEDVLAGLDALYTSKELHGLIRNDVDLLKRALAGDENFKYRRFHVDRAAYERAMAYIVSYNQQNDDNLFTNNCTHAGMRSLNRAGVINVFGTYMPNSLYRLMPEGGDE